jgi:hypothetical protein
MKIGKYITLKHEETITTTDGVNGINVSETRQLRPFEAVIVSENNRACEIKGVRQKHTLDISVSFPEVTEVVKFYQPNDTISEIKDAATVLVNAFKKKSALSAFETVLLPKIYDSNDNLIGTFENYFVDNGNPTQSYNVLKLNYKGRDYVIYNPPSKMQENASWVVYENNEKIVAEIIVDRHKGMSSNRDLKKYDIYVENDEYFNLACILTVVWMKKTGEEELQNQRTSLIDLKEKYSQEFVDNIRNHINPSYLPENMPLVEELYKKGKYEFHRMFGRILVFIGLAVLFIILFLVFLN